jgi:heme exporter protein A
METQTQVDQAEIHEENTGLTAPNTDAAPRQICIRFRDVTHRFGPRSVLKNITAEMYTGQVGIITGSNGSGKSTLLRVAAGLLTPMAGDVEVEVNGQPLAPDDRRAAIGLVAPDLTLYRELTGAENLSFFARLKGIEPTREMLIEALTEVGLRGRGKDLVSGYSSGMRQRLKYAFALLGRPPILMLDEPTANLDVEGIAMVERVVAAQKARPDGGLVLVATNEPRETAWGIPLIQLEATQ